MKETELAENLINTYAIILDEVGQVVFEIDDILYRIFLRHDEEWEIGVYREELITTKVGEVFAFVEIDGGICTGNSRDAITFFL